MCSVGSENYNTNNSGRTTTGLDNSSNNNKEMAADAICPAGIAECSKETANSEEGVIRNVWKHNLEEEFRTIRQVVQSYHYVALDTEFPGIVAHPMGEFRTPNDYQYQLLRCNVNLLRIIQLGLTFLDENGNTPPGCSTWQFNFRFNLHEDMYALDSIDLLRSSGIQFQKHEVDGIEPTDFAELLMSSGIVLLDNIKWICFHSGYDFGYLLKLLTDQNLPENATEYFELLGLYFPNIYDIKFWVKSCQKAKGGLQELADQLQLSRIGPHHQAGSDALLTGRVFFKIREMHNIKIEPTSSFLDFGLDLKDVPIMNASSSSSSSGNNSINNSNNNNAKEHCNCNGIMDI